MAKYIWIEITKRRLEDVKNGVDNGFVKRAYYSILTKKGEAENSKRLYLEVVNVNNVYTTCKEVAYSDILANKENDRYKPFKFKIFLNPNDPLHKGVENIFFYMIVMAHDLDEAIEMLEIGKQTHPPRCEYISDMSEPDSGNDINHLISY